MKLSAAILRNHMFNNLGIWYDDRPMYQVLGWRLCTGAPFDIYLKGLNSSGFYYEMATVVIVTMKSSTLKKLQTDCNEMSQE